MKPALLSFCVFVLITSQGFAADQPREIKIKTEKIGEVVHWMPKEIKVKQGEKLKIVATHDLEGGFDFHGVFIPELKISETVQRHQPKDINVTVPTTLAAGTYKVGCQFHPKHANADLVVEAAEPAKKPDAKTTKK